MANFTMGEILTGKGSIIPGFKFQYIPWCFVTKLCEEAELTGAEFVKLR